jgi:hypothetical protein
MIYTFHHRKGAELRFSQNRGRAAIAAKSPEEAVLLTRELFCHIRDVSVKSRLGVYVVSFKVALDYRMSLLKTVERAMRILRTQEQYSRARYIDRYLVAVIALETGKPEFLAGTNLKEEVSALRKAAVVAREVTNVMRFVDWDIVLYNYLELNFRQGHRSRVVRTVPA